MSELRIAGLGSVQIAAMWQECFESIHDEAGDPFPGSLEGTVLTVAREDFPRAQCMLEDVANGLGEKGPGCDMEYSRAIWAVLDRLRAAYHGKVRLAVTPPA